MKLETAHQICEKIIRENSRSFYAAFKDLPLKKRHAVFSIYAFCRKLDDAIDLHQDLDELNTFEAYLDQINSDLVFEDPVMVALQDSVQRYHIDLKPFYEMIEGQRMDINFTQPINEKELLDYCYHVASTVGLMLLPVLAEKNQSHLRECSIHLGYAMQITNILRDVGEDSSMGRIYLPLDDMTPSIVEAIKTKKVNPEFKVLWEKWAYRAEAYYEMASDQLYLFDEDSRLPLCQSLVYYKAILNAVRKANTDCLSKRQSVSDFISLKREINERLRKANHHE